MTLRRWWWIGWLLLIAGFLNDPPWKFYSPGNRFDPHGESAYVAQNLARSGEFANPFSLVRTGSTAHVAPGYPFVQSLLLRAFGEGAAGWLAIRVLGTYLQSAQYALLPWAARCLGFSPWTGLLAAVLGLIVKAPREEMWENQCAGLLLMLLMVALHHKQRWSGILAGASFLIQPVLAPFYFVWTLFRQRTWLAIIVPLLICAPWIARTYVELGIPVWIRGNLGLELSMSFNDCTPYGTRESETSGCFQTRHPNASLIEAERLRDLGEPAFNSARLHEALTWIAHHPARTASLIVQRAWFFWFPSDHGWPGYAEQRKRALLLHPLTILSWIGLALALRRKIPSAKLLATCLAIYPAIYYIMEFESRYRLPILWITYLLAAHALISASMKRRAAPDHAIIEDSPHVAF